MNALCDKCRHFWMWCDGIPSVVVEEFLGLPGNDIVINCDEYQPLNQVIMEIENQKVLIEALSIGLKELLKNGVYQVRFKKSSDGSIRDMTCTLKPDMLPPVEVKEVKEGAGVKVKTPNPYVVSVYEVGNDWRAFKTDSIIDISKISD